MVKMGGREFQVLKVVTTYEVTKLGEGRLGTAWKLQLDDYRSASWCSSASADEGEQAA